MPEPSLPTPSKIVTPQANYTLPRHAPRERRAQLGEHPLYRPSSSIFDTFPILISGLVWVRSELSVQPQKRHRIEQSQFPEIADKVRSCAKIFVALIEVGPQRTCQQRMSPAHMSAAYLAGSACQQRIWRGAPPSWRQRSASCRTDIRNAPKKAKSCAAEWVPLERAAISGAAPELCIAAGCRKLRAGRRRSPAYVPSACQQRMSPARMSAAMSLNRQ